MCRLATLTILAVILFMTTSIWAGPKYLVTFSLDSVTKDPKSDTDPGTVADKLTFEDANVKVSWFPSQSQFGFMLENKTSKSLKILWDESSFVSQSGEGHKVMHVGTKYSEKEGSIPPTMIPAKANVKDGISPSDYAYYTEGNKYMRGGWNVHDIYEEKWPKDKDADKQAAALNQTLRIILTLEQEAQKVSYDFAFKAEKVEKK